MKNFLTIRKERIRLTILLIVYIIVGMIGIHIECPSRCLDNVYEITMVEQIGSIISLPALLLLMPVGAILSLGEVFALFGSPFLQPFLVVISIIVEIYLLYTFSRLLIFVQKIITSWFQTLKKFFLGSSNNVSK